VKKFNTLKVPKKVEANLPYASKQKNEVKRKSKVSERSERASRKKSIRAKTKLTLFH